MSSSQKTIVVCGGGLAGSMVTVSLLNGLGEGFQIIQINDPASPSEDVFYGSVTSPESYNFLRSIGLDEPLLLLQSDTSFSYGTHYRQWLSSTSWMQCHHAPLPVITGVPMRHHLTRSKISLEPLLISAQAAMSGRFAHPPEDPNNPLSRAEYGYQFSTAQWTKLLEQQITMSRVHQIKDSIETFNIEKNSIKTIYLNSGETVTGDLFIDATGSSHKGILAAGGTYNSDRDIAAWLEVENTDQLGPPCRFIEAGQDGWSAATFLQDSQHKLTVGQPEANPNTPPDSQIKLGQMDKAWIGNCVAIGQAACALEPFTPAPMMLLQRDIERLLELIPVCKDMTTERREFNRRFEQDVTHANMFQKALLASRHRPDTSYWRDASQSPTSNELDRKINQFKNRGVLVSYDLEPFNEEDWTIAHLGMDRQPNQYDRQLDGIPPQQVEQQLAQIKQMIDQLVSRMPPHHIYMTKLKQYIESQIHA